MAAAIVPLISVLEPVVIPLIVRLLDRLFGSKTGAAKLSTAATVVQQIAQGVAASSSPAIPTVPSLPDITASVQRVVDALNAQGQLQGPNTVITDATSAIPNSGIREAGGTGGVGGLNVQSAIQVLQWLAAMPPSLLERAHS